MSIIVEIGDKDISVNESCNEDLRNAISERVVSAWETSVVIPWSENAKEKHWILKVKDLICGINTKRRIHTLAVVSDAVIEKGYTLLSTFARTDGSHTLIFRKI